MLKVEEMYICVNQNLQDKKKAKWKTWHIHDKSSALASPFLFFFPNAKSNALHKTVCHHSLRKPTDLTPSTMTSEQQHSGKQV